ncbi:hypothetical protein [Bacillus xiapuensis]|uniref:hypothetical protein n=1 Tax=Bacillus xiapuensis TaxID=2014075 RepID=UPI001E362D46|nr:hypothetical protein [Bacillus xiapuensis]
MKVSLHRLTWRKSGYAKKETKAWSDQLWRDAIVEFFLLSGCGLVLSFYVTKKQRMANYTFENDVLVFYSGNNQVSIPLTDVVEVVKMKSDSRSYLIFQWLGQTERLAVYTSTNLTYLLTLQNGRAFFRRLKKQYPDILATARAI